MSKAVVQRHAMLSAVYDVTATFTATERALPLGELGQTREGLLRWIRMSRTLEGLRVTWERRWVYWEEQATICAGCQARPSLWDLDCDGPYDTVQCGQCDWHAAYRQRNPYAYA